MTHGMLAGLTLALLAVACGDAEDDADADADAVADAGASGLPGQPEADADGCSSPYMPHRIREVALELTYTLDGAPVTLAFEGDAEYTTGPAVTLAVGGSVAAGCGGATRNEPTDPRQAAVQLIFVSEGVPALTLVLNSAAGGRFDASDETAWDESQVILSARTPTRTGQGVAKPDAGTVTLSPEPLVEGAPMEVRFDGLEGVMKNGDLKTPFSLSGRVRFTLPQG